MAAPKKKKERNKVPDELHGLAGEIAAVDQTSKDSIIKIGVRLEQAWTAMRVHGADKAMLNLLKQSLTALQKLYQEELKDAASVWSIVGLAVQAAQDSLAGKEGGVDEVLAATENIRTLLDGATPPVAKSKPDVPARKATSTEPVDLLARIEGAAARLMGIAPGETEELPVLRDELITLVGAPELAGGALGHLTVATQQLEAVLQGKLADSGPVIDQITKMLGQAAQVQETSQSNSTSSQGSPAPEPAPVAPSKSAPVQSVIEFAGPAIMADDTDEELLNEYIIESLDHITNAEGSLLELESNPDNRDQIDVVFRAYHTIKGTSGFLGFDRIQKLAHLAENLLDRAREGKVKIKGGYADLCLRSCDSLRTMLESLRGVQAGEELTIPDDLMDLLEILTDPEAAGYSEQVAENDPLRVGDILVARGKTDRKNIENIEKAKGNEKIGQAAVEKGVATPTEVVEAIRTQKQIKQGQGSSIEGSIRVGTNRLDSLINMVGELVIAQSMVTQDPSITSGTNPRLQRNVSHAGKIIRELQDLTMALRMVPLKSIFQKMNRLVRDLGRKSGKKVQFITEGEDTEIDRNMVESLNDPLVHMIRNSMDHGVESAEERRAKGKEETGTVWLRAYHAAGNVVIELQDDGKGLDHGRILAKAVEKGVVEKGRDLTDTDVFNLIFAPGFSTAEKVTEVSGRGVGMDVVKRNIEKLRGRIEVASKADQGSTFTIRLPLTMAIADAMILRVGQDRYLLPTVSIEQSFQPEPGTISTVTGRGEMVMLRGELLPLFRLHELFAIENAVKEPYEALLIVIEGDGKRCALMVDELLDQQQVVIKSLGQTMTQVPGISGGAILGDGRVGLILDATGLLQLAEGRADLVEAEAMMA